MRFPAISLFTNENLNQAGKKYAQEVISTVSVED